MPRKAAASAEESGESAPAPRRSEAQSEEADKEALIRRKSPTARGNKRKAAEEPNGATEGEEAPAAKKAAAKPASKASVKPASKPQPNPHPRPRSQHLVLPQRSLPHEQGRKNLHPRLKPNNPPPRSAKVDETIAEEPEAEAAAATVRTFP
ncbi:hypothetical protein BDZ97DRAFT_1918911 [Flammula alnicola]|nr:hypothetical protein BDZ97DRAFT_1918911 [Flammula alnicola]